MSRRELGWTGLERGYEARHGLGRDYAALQARDQWLADRIMEVLQLHYPGHPWRVEVEHHRNIGGVKIWIPVLTQWHVWLRIDDLKADPSFKLVVRHVGAYLERLNIGRAGFSLGDFERAKSSFARLTPSKRIVE